MMRAFLRPIEYRFVDNDLTCSPSILSSHTSTRPPSDLELVTKAASLGESPGDFGYRTQSPASSTTSSTATFSSRRSGGGSRRPARTAVTTARSPSPIPFSPPRSAGKASLLFYPYIYFILVKVYLLCVRTECENYYAPRLLSRTHL